MMRDSLFTISFSVEDTYEQDKKIVTALLSVLVVLLLFFGLQRLVEPKYADDVPEGNFTAEYYDETTEHDVLLVGDCEVYENIDPMYLWKQYGITSYIRGNAQQLTWQSYYLLEEALQYETPKVVIYNVQALTHGEPQREEYNRMTLDGMKWSKIKYQAIQASMCSGENMLDYIFPILRYHGRILELNQNDLTYYNKARKVTHNGYYMRIDVLPVSESDVADTEWLFGTDTEEEEEIQDPWEEIEGADEALEDPWGEIDGADADEAQDSAADSTTKEGELFGEYPMEYLDKMRRLCEANDITLILMKAPSLAPEWYESDNRQVEEYAQKYQLTYINFYDLLEETGIDYETDTYDGGLHMNLSGADKLSKYLGRVLSEEYGLADHRDDEALKKVYNEKYTFYLDMQEKQQEEIDTYGEIRSY
ncbi:MAG: SGNH/GDSL hydrolase family protein [Clostridiaceae bacterium]|nr:SGNH/GDSL hydrolase family protein [Clostridiaceae bacterium]